MYKWLIWMIALMLAVPVGWSSRDNVSADTATGGPITMYSNKWAVMPSTSTAPVIDGVLSDNSWDENGAAVLDDFRTVYTNEPIPNGPTYKLTYDSSNLYFGGTFASEDKAILEKIELVVSTAAYGESHYVVTIPITPISKPTSTDWNVGRDFIKENPQRVQVSPNSVTTATYDAGARTALELTVPLSALDASLPTPGTEWRVNVVHVYHLNTKPLISWIPIRTTSFWNSGNGVIFKGNVVDEGRLGSVFFGRTPVGERWTPEETDFRYLGFVEKELSFKRGNVVNPSKTLFSVKWKNPVGGWEPLTQVTSEKLGSRCKLTFEHPPLIDFGQVELQIYAYRENQPNDGHFTIVTFDRDALIEAGIAAMPPITPSSGSVQVNATPASQLVQDTLDIIPDRTGFLFTGLPEMPELHPLQLYQLSADRKKLVASKTGTVYPNAQYPETHVLTATNRKGQIVEYPYYEDAVGKRYFLSAHLWYLQKNYAAEQTEKIAKTDALGAARLLYRFAQAYEGYVPTTDYIWLNSPINITSGPPFNYWGGMWDRWSVSDLNRLRPLLHAYEQVKKTNALEVLSQEAGEDVDQKLIEQMFTPSVRYALSYPYTISNMNYTQWLGLIDAGKVLKEPDYIHNTYEWIQDYVETQFLSDGYWKEVAPSYHVQSTNGLDQGMRAIAGYSDPIGYVSPRTGKHFDNLDMGQDYPIIPKALKDNNLLVYPDGKLLPLQDSWASDRASAPIQNAGSFLMPAAGIGRLTSGSGTNQSQLWLQFAPKYGHNHYDPLQLNLYAEGQELLPDLGYTYTKDRNFTLSTMGHNTVVVDSKDMKVDSVSRDGGKIDLFAPVGPVQAMRADEKEAYDGLEAYSREPWHVSFPDAEGGQGYVIDLFRVSGGSRHEYTLQGDANRDSVFQTDMTLESYGPYLLPPGTQVREPEQFNDRGDAEGNYYGYISVKDVKKAQLPSDRYDLTLVTSESGIEKAKMKITGLLESGSNELYLGRSPSIRSTRLSGGSKDTNDEAVKYNMPKLVLRRDGSNLTSTFVTAMEPYQGASGPRIDTIDRLQPTVGPEGAVAVKVTYGNTTDVLISSPGGPNDLVVVDDITMRGKLGFIRMVNGVVQSMYVIGGTQLSKGSQTLTGNGPVEGTITATKRKVNGDPYDGIVVPSMIDSTTSALRGKYAVVTHPDQTTNGYLIQDIVSDSGHSVIVFAEHDPGFDIRPDGTSRMNFYPLKSWTGTHTFRIDNVDIYEVNPLQAVALQASKQYLLSGEKATLSVQATRRDGSAPPTWATQVTYTSSDPSIVKVDPEGTVTAVGEGAATITAVVEWNGMTKTSSLVFTSQKRAYGVFNFVDLPIAQQSTSTLYVPGSNTLQLEANQAGESITFEFEVGANAPYEIGIKPFQAASYGIYQVAIDGAPLASYNFYASSSGASTVFQPLGTMTLAPGTHTISLVNAGKNSSSTNYKFGLIQLELRESLLDAPTLSPPGGPIFQQETATISYPDNPAWRGQMVSVAVNGVPLSSALYTVSAGHIAFASGALGSFGPKRIVISAAGYRHAIVELQLLPSSALSGLTVNSGVIVPSLNPGVFDYAVSVEHAVTSISVTASTYRPDSIMTVTGQVYTAAGQFLLPLQVGDNSFPITVNAANGESSVYTLKVIRAGVDLSPTGIVSGTVYGQGGSPVAGVQVMLAGYTSHAATTNAAGAFLIEGSPAGQHRLVMTKPGFTRTITEPFHVTQGQNVALSVYFSDIDTVPPVLSVDQRNVPAGQPVLVSVNEPARLYLVPYGTAANAAAIVAASAGPNGSFADGTELSLAAVSTSGFAKGKYRLYGIDSVNNVSAAPIDITVMQIALGTLDDHDPTLTYKGQWNSYTGTYVGGKMLLSSDITASVEIPFYGSRAKWVGTRNAVYGIANVYVDGQFVTTVDLFNSTLQTQQSLFDTGVLSSGTHVLKISVTGQKNAAANGTYVSFDAVQITDLGLVLPVVSNVTAGPVRIGTQIMATSSDSGTLYLVKSGTAANSTALEQAVTVGQSVYGLKASVVGGTPISFNTSNMAPGVYQVYAVNNLGVVSVGSAPITIIQVALGTLDDNDPTLTYKGQWTSYTGTYVGGKMLLSKDVAGSVEIPFYGSRAKWVGARNKVYGIANVYVDGQFVTTVDLYNPTLQTQMSLFDTGVLQSGIHVLKIAVTGQKNAAATDTYVAFDAVQVTDLGLIPPVVSNVTAGPVRIGTQVGAASSDNGTLYLVKSGTAANSTALEQAVTVGQSVYGLKTSAVSGTPISFDTSNMAPGRYQVYAVNGLGAVSTGSAPIAIVANYSTSIDSSSPLAVYTGSWFTDSNASYFGGTEAIGAAANSTVEVPFYGTRGVVFGTLASNGGLAEFYVDGQYVNTYDFYRSGTGVAMQQIRDTGTLPLGVHTLRIVNTGNKNPLSQNTWLRFDVLQTTAP